MFAALADELHAQPVAGVRELVAQHLRPAVEVVDHQVEAAVVVEVADREAAAHARVGEHGAVARRDVVERAVAAVAVEQLALPVAGGRAEPRLVELRVHVAVDGDQVEPAVVVVVEERRAPADVGQASWPRSSSGTTRR